MSNDYEELPGRREFYAKLQPHQLVNQDSGIVDYCTPAFIIETARRTMGTIDLDPASNLVANQTVKAKEFFDKYGLTHIWSGNVWLNHPFDRVQNARWIEKLINSYTHGDVSQACCITFASTSEKWFQPLLQFPQCYLSPRTNYIRLDGTPVKGVTKGSVVTYLGSNFHAFAKEFDSLGNVVLPYAWIYGKRRLAVNA